MIVQIWIILCNCFFFWTLPTIQYITVAPEAIWKWSVTKCQRLLNAGAKRRSKNIDVPLHFSMVPLHVRGHYRRVQLLSQIISEFNSEKKMNTGPLLPKSGIFFETRCISVLHVSKLDLKVNSRHSSVPTLFSIVPLYVRRHYKNCGVADYSIYINSVRGAKRLLGSSGSSSSSSSSSSMC